MRVAFTSSTGTTIDEHFGQASRFFIWEVGPEAAEVVGQVATLSGGDEEDRIAARASAIAGCAIVYTQAIGGPAAAKLVARRVHPMKTGDAMPVAEAIEKLQQVLRGRPPPWLRRLLGPIEGEPPALEAQD